MAEASEGIWIWDAIDSSYFVLQVHLCMILGDVLGSAKLSGMAGHSAVYGDHFSNVKGACSSTNKGAKAQYYPMSPPDTVDLKYNKNRIVYDIRNIPICTEEEYWITIEKLEMSRGLNKHSKVAEIVKQTGVSHLPLCAASKAFAHPTFFPPNPFHLLYENIMAFLWDLWVKSKPTDPYYISEEQLRKFGELVALAMSTLPPSFHGPIHDPFLKHNSQYKIYEWMALLHWYILPIGMELQWNPLVLQNFSYFVCAVEFAMTIKARSENEILYLQELIITFLKGFKQLYVGKNPENIFKARLCVFQLIYVPQHIVWNAQ